jgi:hypothetical protein
MRSNVIQTVDIAPVTNFSWNDDKLQQGNKGSPTMKLARFPNVVDVVL